MENDILLKAYVIGLIGAFCGCWLFAAIYNIVHDILLGRKIRVKNTVLRNSTGATAFRSSEVFLKKS